MPDLVDDGRHPGGSAVARGVQTAIVVRPITVRNHPAHLRQFAIRDVGQNGCEVVRVVCAAGELGEHVVQVVRALALTLERGGVANVRDRAGRVPDGIAGVRSLIVCSAFAKVIGPSDGRACAIQQGGQTVVGVAGISAVVGKSFFVTVGIDIVGGAADCRNAAGGVAAGVVGVLGVEPPIAVPVAASISEGAGPPLRSLERWER